MAPIFRPLSGLAPSKLKIVSKNVIVKYINEDFKLKLVTTKGWYGVIKIFLAQCRKVRYVILR